MREIEVLVKKYQSEYDDTIFDSWEDCALYDETYQERNFVVNPDKLKKFTDKTWEHFKFEFLQNYAVALYNIDSGWYGRPIHRDFFKNVNDAESFRHLIQTALRNTFTSKKVNAYGGNIKYSHLIRTMDYTGENGMIGLKAFWVLNQKGESRLHTDTLFNNYPYKYIYTISLPESTFKSVTDRFYPHYIPSNKSFLDFLHFIYDTDLIQNHEFIENLLDYAINLRDFDSVKYLSCVHDSFDAKKTFISILKNISPPIN